MKKSHLYLLVSLSLVLGCGEKDLSPEPAEEAQKDIDDLRLLMLE